MTHAARQSEGAPGQHDHGATGSLRVLVVDDHPVVRAGMVGLLATEPGIVVVGEAADGAEAVSAAGRCRPDVVLMDLQMPVLDGVEATRQVLRIAEPAPQSRPDPSPEYRPRVIVLTTYESDEQILAAIEAGASGYLLKASPPEEIVAGIRSVAAGSVALSPSVAAALVQRVREGTAVPEVGSADAASPAPLPSVPSAPPAVATELLTVRELQVLTLVALGHSNRTIGRELFIGEATVRSHLLKIFAKLVVSDRTRAVTRAQELGLLPTLET